MPPGGCRQQGRDTEARECGPVVPRSQCPGLGSGTWALFDGWPRLEHFHFYSAQVSAARCGFFILGRAPAGGGGWRQALPPVPVCRPVLGLPRVPPAPVATAAVG